MGGVTSKSHGYTGLTQKIKDFAVFSVLFVCRPHPHRQPYHHQCSPVTVSFGGQAPRWYPRFTLGDLFVTTLIVKWPGSSFGGQAPRWYPRFCWAAQKKKKGGAIHSGQWY